MSRSNRRAKKREKRCGANDMELQRRDQLNRRYLKHKGKRL